jgi:Kazal-type serine protease inhibitor domain
MGKNPQATYVHDGECGSGLIVGGDKDAHGCIGSAGYVWDTGAQQCLRPWEKPAVACTKEYAPVCGSTAGVNMTYGNMCTLKAAGAKVVYVWECVTGLAAGEGYRYHSIASLLDSSYLAKTYTPIQAANYTQTLIDKIDNTLKVAKMRAYALHKLQLMKKFLETYKSMITL